MTEENSVDSLNLLEKKRKKFDIIGSKFVFLIPSLAFFAIFAFIPLIVVAIISFFSWDLLGPMKFVGIENFIDMFTDANFWNTLMVTLKFEVMVVPMVFILSLILALLLYKEGKFSSVFRAFFYWPYMAPAVVSGTIWAWLFSTNTGFINSILVRFGLSPIPWLQDSFTALLVISLTQVWGMAGFMMMVFITGLEQIPIEFEEAASIDGASHLQIFRYITWPLLKGTSIIVLVLSIAYSWNNFTLMYVMTTGGPGYATTITSLYIYQLAFTQFRIGYASAVSVVTVLISIGIAIAAMKTGRWEV